MLCGNFIPLSQYIKYILIRIVKKTVVYFDPFILTQADRTSQQESCVFCPILGSHYHLGCQMAANSPSKQEEGKTEAFLSGILSDQSFECSF